MTDTASGALTAPGTVNAPPRRTGCHTGTGRVVVDFDDKSSWEYLFKEYWQDVKRKMSLNREEVINASNPWKGVGARVPPISSNELHNAHNKQNDGSDNLKHQLEKDKSAPKRQKKKPRIDAADKVLPIITRDISGDGASELTNSERWASKELLYFVEHMNVDKSTLSVFEVQSLLMEYVTKYQLRDPHKKSQILCDARLQSLFGKARLGHLEMMKLIESHILKKETSLEAPKIQRGNAEDDTNQVELEGSTTPKTGSDKKRKLKKKADEGTQQANVNDYAAIDTHNINLIYLRRNLVEDLLDDMEKFQEKVVGSFVRIRISGSGNKQDMYRLVQVVGTSKAAKEYRTGKKSTDIMLEILNLNKTEAITTDSVSNQEFSEGEIQEKAKALQQVKVNDWFDTEILKLGHLRDRAKKLQVLNDPAERARRLQEVAEVHADPNMDPNYESEETEEDDRKRENYARPRDTGYPKRGWDALSPGKGVIVDGLDGSQKSSNSPWERIKNSSASREPRIERGQCGIVDKTLSQSKSSYSHCSEQNNDTGNRAWSQGSNQLSSGMLPEIPTTPQAVGVTASANNTDTEKMWHYSDPSGKIQGPFSMVQLRKWSTTGYFPSDLRIWRTSEKQEDAVLLNDALMGKYQQESSQSDLQGTYANAQKVGGVGSWDNSSHDRNLPGANHSTWTGSDQRDGNWKSSWKEAGGFVSGSAEITRKDGQERQSTSWSSSSMESLEPSQGHVTTVSSAQDPSGGSTPWSSESFGHSPKMLPSDVDNSYTASLQQTTDTRVGVSGVKFSHSESHVSPWSPTKPLEVQPSGTWNTSNGYDNHLGSLASSTQSLRDGEKSDTENIPSKEIKEASPLASATSAAGSPCNAISIRTDRLDLSISNLTQTSATSKWMKDPENKPVAPHSVGEPVGHVDNLSQQSSVTSPQMENQISESKAPDLHASVEVVSHLNNLEQQSSLTAIQSKDRTSENKTSDSQVLLEPASAVNDNLRSSNTAIQSVDKISKNAQVSDGPLSPVNDLERRSPITGTQLTISSTATDRQQANLVTSAMEHDAMTLGSTGIGGVWTSGQNSGAMSAGSSPEPTIGVVLDADKYPKIVPVAIHPVSSTSLGPSTHALLQSVTAGLSHVIHNDGQNCDNNMSSDLLAQDVSARTDLTAAHADTGSADSLHEPMDTQDALLANENPESSQFVIIAAEESTVDEIWDGLLDAEGGEPVTDFFPEDLDTDKVEGSIESGSFCSSPSQLEDSKIKLSESQIPVSVEGSSQPDGWVSDSGFGSSASGCGVSSTAASIPMSQGSEMISQPVAYISNDKGEGFCLASERQESLQKPVDIPQSNIPRDGWLSPQTSPEVSEVIQSVNPTGTSDPCSEHDQDAGASVVTTDAAGSVASSNTADQGMRDVSWASDSSPLLVSAGEQTPATSGSGDVPPTVQHSQGSNRLPGSFSVSASEAQAPSSNDVSDMAVAASTSQVSGVFSGDFSVSTTAEQAKAPSAWDAVSNKVRHPQTTRSGGFSVSATATATAPMASSDAWSTQISATSSNVPSLPPPMAGNTSSGVANLYLGKSSYRSAVPESWGSPSKNLAGPTDKQGVPSSHSTWRPGGVSEPSVSRRSGWGPSVESSRAGWSQQPGNTNARWGVDSVNQRGGWEQQRREGDRYSGYGDRGGYGGQGHGMRPWSKQPGGGGSGSVSGGGPRPPRSQKVCKFHENGYCKKGASCDFLHP
ncbi:Zinc finger CCCH domain-containing protein 19 [Nymphaea thermarum]|nr:Zinc finger CCCH domain-containing protein 19 [Nymphaea thermarum]